jgi:hypothetical protein
MADLLHREVGLVQKAPRLGHAALGDPLLYRPSCPTLDDRGEAARREVNRPRHVLKRNGISVALLDEAEDLDQQGLVVEPENSHHLGGQPGDVYEQQPPKCVPPRWPGRGSHRFTTTLSSSDG